MDSQTRAAIDKLDILNVLAAYARGIDRVDLDLLKSVYWEDGVDNHGDYFCGSGWAYAEQVCEQMPKLFNTTSHMLGQTWFAWLTGTRALTETYFCSTHDPLDPAQPPYSNHGRYIDLFEKRGGAWRILRRDGVFDLHGSRRFGAAKIAGETRRAPGDVSYERVGSVKAWSSRSDQD